VGRSPGGSGADDGVRPTFIAIRTSETGHEVGQAVPPAEFQRERGKYHKNQYLILYAGVSDVIF
jgi:hypothetical protein